MGEHWHAQEEKRSDTDGDLSKDPFEEIRNTTSIRFVMKDGELYEGDTLDEVWPKQQVTGPFWWSNDQP